MRGGLIVLYDEIRCSKGMSVRMGQRNKDLHDVNRMQIHKM